MYIPDENIRPLVADIFAHYLGIQANSFADNIQYASMICNLNDIQLDEDWIKRNGGPLPDEEKEKILDVEFLNVVKG